MSIERCLHEEIVLEFDELRKLEVGSEQYRHTLDGLTKLMDRSIEMDRLDFEVQEKQISRDNEERFRERQMREEKIDRIIKNVVNAVGVFGGMGLTIWGVKVSMRFEETGSITTTMGKGFFNRLLPRK